MADRSKIEWTDATWTPIRARERKTGRIGWHCVHVSAGCEHCYAEAINRRLGTGFGYRAQDTVNVEIVLDEKTLTAPFRWRKPRRIFVCSMTDLFADFVTDAMIDRVFAVMALTPQHSYQVLTKRADRMRGYASDPQAPFRVAKAMDALSATRPTIAWPLPQIWLGVSVEDQQRADERIPHLLATPAAVRWVSAEPLLGPVELRPYMGMVPHFRTRVSAETGNPVGATEHGWIQSYNVRTREEMPSPLQWVVCGGESGPGARPCDVAWIRSTIAQCRAAGVPVFVKQLGARPVSMAAEGALWPYHVEWTRDDLQVCTPIFRSDLRDKKGGDISEFPEDLRVREWPK